MLVITEKLENLVKQGISRSSQHPSSNKFLLDIELLHFSVVNNVLLRNFPMDNGTFQNKNYDLVLNIECVM